MLSVSMYAHRLARREKAVCVCVERPGNDESTAKMAEKAQSPLEGLSTKRRLFVLSQSRMIGGYLRWSASLCVLGTWTWGRVLNR